MEGFVPLETRMLHTLAKTNSSIQPNWAANYNQVLIPSRIPSYTQDMANLTPRAVHYLTQTNTTRPACKPRTKHQTEDRVSTQCRHTTSDRDGCRCSRGRLRASSPIAPRPSSVRLLHESTVRTGRESLWTVYCSRYRHGPKSRQCI